MPNKASATLPMHFVTSLFEGLPLDSTEQLVFLKQAGIPQFLLQASQGRVTLRQFSVLYRLLVKHYQDEMPGFFSRPFRPGALKFLCLAILEAPNLHIALQRVCQYFRVLMDDMAYQLEVEGNLAHLILVEKLPPKGNRVLVHELLLKFIHGLASWLLAEKIPPLQVSCAYSRPAHSAEYLYFHSGEVLFEQPHTRMSFDREFLKQPLRRHRSALSIFLRDAPEDWMYVSFAEQLLAHQVRDYLQQDRLAASSPEVALALHLSPRTFSRRLAAEGTHFQAIKDEVRRDLAIQELTSGQQTLIDLASWLGFEDLPSFNRAFKRWTGSTPGAYRRS